MVSPDVVCMYRRSECNGVAQDWGSRLGVFGESSDHHNRLLDWE